MMMMMMMMMMMLMMSILFDENKSPDECTVFVYANGERDREAITAQQHFYICNTVNILLPVVQHRGHVEKTGKNHVKYSPITYQKYVDKERPFYYHTTNEFISSLKMLCCNHISTCP